MVEDGKVDQYEHQLAVIRADSKGYRRGRTFGLAVGTAVTAAVIGLYHLLGVPGGELHTYQVPAGPEVMRLERTFARDQVYVAKTKGVYVTLDEHLSTVEKVDRKTVEGTIEKAVGWKE